MKLFSSLSLILAGSLALAANPIKTTITKNQTTAQVKVEADAKVQTQMLDLLFVVDNSSSMELHQKNIANHIDSFIAEFKKIDTRAGVITTDSLSGQLFGPFLSSKSNDFIQDLKNQILAVGTNGSFDVMIFSPVLKAISLNKNFIREKANLAIIVISDGDDSSSMTTQDFVNKLNSLKPKEKITLLSLDPAGEAISNTECSKYGAFSPKFDATVAALNGQLIVLCSADYTKSVQKVAHDLITKTDLITLDIRQFKLPLAPILNSVSVTYGSTTLQRGDFLQGWYYDSKKQTINIGADFDYTTEPQETKLVIDYLANYSSNITQ